MKNLFTLSLLLLIATVTFTSCNNSKKPKKKETNLTEKKYSVESKATKVNWTAYKTTNKVPVKGVFTKLNIENATKASSVKEALNGLKFNIPVSSIYTKDTIRDGKLKKFFFGIMENTTLISGTFFVNNETSGTVNLTMNNITHTLPITYNISDLDVTIEAVMNLDNWQAQTALKALNKACKDLHSGDDGIPKTWNEVKIEVVTHLKYN